MPTCPKCLGNRYLNSHGGPAYSSTESSIQCPRCSGFGFITGGGKGGEGTGKPTSGTSKFIILIAGGIGGFLAYSANAPADFAYVAAVLGFIVVATGARIAASFAAAPLSMFLSAAFLVAVDYLVFDSAGVKWLGTSGVELIGRLFTG